MDAVLENFLAAHERPRAFVFIHRENLPTGPKHLEFFKKPEAHVLAIGPGMFESVDGQNDRAAGFQGRLDASEQRAAFFFLQKRQRVDGDDDGIIRRAQFEFAEVTLNRIDRQTLAALGRVRDRRVAFVDRVAIGDLLEVFWMKCTVGISRGEVRNV